MGDAIQALRTHLGEISDIEMAAGVLGWDQQTYMPPGGAEGRAQQLSTLSRLAHTWFTSDKTRELLDAARPEADAMGDDSDEAALVRTVRHDYEKGRKLPNDFVAEFTRATIISNEAWRKARAANDFAAFRPHLEAMVDYCRRMADLYGYEEHPYDALLDLHEQGLTTAEVRDVFAVLRPFQVDLVRRIAGKPEPRTDFLARDYPEDGQRRFALEVVQRFGYDLSRGRLDIAPHPFETDFGRNDVRITTRYDRHMPQQAIYGVFHEAGHAMYEQNVSEVWDRTPLDTGASMVFHESQSRLWENIIGRGRAVVEHFYPMLRETFPDQLADVSPDEYHRAINRVAPSLIRVEADEVTYNLHVMVRFELEMALVTGDLRVADLPDAWAAKMRDYLGVAPPDDADGVMQDSHWSQGSIGYFPTYALGNVMSAQIFTTANAAHPEIPEQLAKGEFDTLRGWLAENLYRHGRKYPPKDLALRVNGEPLNPRPYMDYLQTKYGELYGI